MHKTILRTRNTTIHEMMTKDCLMFPQNEKKRRKQSGILLPISTREDNTDIEKYMKT